MSFLDQLGGGAAAETPICSRKACRQDAQWQLLWNNPKIHTSERRKIWLACAEHLDWLQDYLVQRSLWRETLPLEEASTPESGL